MRLFVIVFFSVNIGSHVTDLENVLLPSQKKKLLESRKWKRISARSVRGPPEVSIRCPNINGPFPTFVDSPFSCNEFYICDNGIAWKQSCASTLHFNPITEVCDYPVEIYCEERKMLENIALYKDKICNSSRQFFIVEFFGNPDECGVFYQCHKRSLHAFRCPKNFHFNKQLQACSHSLRSDCASPQVISNSSEQHLRLLEDNMLNVYDETQKRLKRMLVDFKTFHRDAASSSGSAKHNLRKIKKRDLKSKITVQQQIKEIQTILSDLNDAISNVISTSLERRISATSYDTTDFI